MRRTLLLAACVSALTASSALSSLVTWDLNPGNVNGNVGSSSQSYNVSGYSITASGYDRVAGPDAPHDLFYKSDNPVDGGSEHGLGFVGTPNNELQVNSNGTVPHYIQLDLRSILSAGFTGGEVEVGSIQAGESFRIFGSNTAGSIGTQLAGTWSSSFDEKFVTVPNFGAYQFIALASNEGDVLPVAFRASVAPVPEMSALFPIIGLVAAVASTQILRRRKRKSAANQIS